MIEVVLREQPTEVIPKFKVSVNGTDAGFVHRNVHNEEAWHVLGRETAYTSREAAACMVAARWFESEARKRKTKKEASG